MKTLIELFDERPIENVLSSEMFHPERTIFLCAPEVYGNHKLREQLKAYFRHRGVKSELIFVTANMVDVEDITNTLRRLVDQYPDCAIDIAGGTDAALFACGVFCKERELQVFTYSRRKNRYYNVMNAPYADNIPCNIKLQVEDCFMMAGGSMRAGRVDNEILGEYADLVEPFFDVFLKYHSSWAHVVSYMQRASQTIDGSYSLEVNAPLVVKGSFGTEVANQEALRDLEDIGMIHDLTLKKDSLSFRFADKQVRAWLRDVGSVLEIFVYKCCQDMGIFDDVYTSAVVDWQIGGEMVVSNEIDVMAVRGVRPVFISCKACDVQTEALNELAILRDRFGGGEARAAIVTASHGRMAMRNRATELGIEVIDLDDFEKEEMQDRLRALVNR